MNATVSQKFLLTLVFLGIGVLRLVERLGAVARWFLGNSLRAALYIIVVTVAVKGFYIESSVGSNLENIPSVITPTSTSILGVSETPVKEPVLLAVLPSPIVTAKSILAKDVESGKVLLETNGGEKFAPASTTKLMTALVALDLYSLNDEVKIPEPCTTIEGQKAGFHAEDTYTARSLLESLLIGSSADAACALSLGKVSYSEFVNQMNEKASDMKLSNTHFTNPVGLDSGAGDNFSTANDLFYLALEAKKDSFIAQTVRTTEKAIKSLEGNEMQVFNTNQLLWSLPGTVGIKTGKTEAAGEVLIYEYEDDTKDIIIVVMGSQDRFVDTQNILNWILSSYGWEA